MKIAAQTIVKNEARFVWYSIMSVISYVDIFRVWDTGSNDGTKEIIEEIKKTKEAKALDIFEYNEYPVSDYDEEKARGEALRVHKSGPEEWFIVVDGDEIWWDSSIARLTQAIRNHSEEYESLIVPTVNLVGDMYHYQEKNAGQYLLKGKKGHYALRAVNLRIPGLKSLGKHGQWGWVDGGNQMIQYRNQEKIIYVNAPYLHTTFLQRAGTIIQDKEVLKRSGKLKHELGENFPSDFYYPEVFFRPRPNDIASPWASMDVNFKFNALFQTPLRKIKRRIFPSRVGY